VIFGIGALKLFDQAYLVSGGSGGPAYATYTPVLYIYREAFAGNAQFGVAAAAGVVLLLIIFVLTLASRATVGRAEVG
jgi:multiple sugar transport system permease protein